MTILAVLSLIAWAYLLAGHGRFWQAGPVLAPDRPTHAPAVAAVVPARNEAPFHRANYQVVARAGLCRPVSGDTDR
jgi:hypothetical protein